MPRSRSRSLESIARSATRWFSRKEPDCCSSRSTRVVLPWSTWAMIATLRNDIREIRWGPAEPGLLCLQRNIVQSKRAQTATLQRWRAGMPAEVKPNGESTRSQRKRTRSSPRTSGRAASCVAPRRRRRCAREGWEVACAARSQSRTDAGSCAFFRITRPVRHVQPRLSADEGGARLHAAAGPPPDRGLHAGRLAGPLHRREYPQGHRRRASSGPTSSWSAACTSRRRRSTISPSARTPPAKSSMLGGPSASASPEMYPDIDYLHIGEMGDATDRLIALPR